MQSDIKEIYRITSERTGKKEDIYKDIGNFVFTELYSMMKKPKSLIIKLKGVGFWFLRKKRLHLFMEKNSTTFNKKREDFSNNDEFLRNENQRELYLLFAERLKEYDEYIELKKEIRGKRNKMQDLLIPNKDEE